MIGKLLDYKKVYGTTNVEHGKKDFLDLRNGLQKSEEVIGQTNCIIFR